MAKQMVCFIKEARSHIDEWDAESAFERLAAGGVLVVDVREADEFATGHIAGSMHVPRGLIEAAVDVAPNHFRNAQLAASRQAPVLLVCQSGGRSAMVAWVLQQMGFENVHSLAGGLECWTAEGYDLQQG